MNLACLVAVFVLGATAAAAQAPAKPPPSKNNTVKDGAAKPAPAPVRLRPRGFTECHAMARQRRLRGAERRRFTALCQADPAYAPKG